MRGRRASPIEIVDQIDHVAHVNSPIGIHVA
jgi:hypothetical protein